MVENETTHEPVTPPIDVDKLTDAQFDGRACVVRGNDGAPMAVVGIIASCQTFACRGECGAKVAA